MDGDRRFDIAATAIIILSVVITIYVSKYFLSTILLGIVLVYILRPVYEGIFWATRSAWLSSLLSLLIVFAVVMAVLFILSSLLLNEVLNLQQSGDIHLSELSGEIDLWVDGNLPRVVAVYLEGIGDIPAALASFAYPIVMVELTSLASNLPMLIAQSLVAILFTYYLLIDCGHFIGYFLGILPISKRDIVHHFIEELDKIYTTLFTVYFIVAILSGIIAAVGLFLMGVPYPLVWGAIIAIFALLPILGPPFVFVPMILYYLLISDYLRSLILAILCIVLMVIPENIIAPQLALRSARIHPLITVIAYTAPIFVVGAMGVIIGPALYGFLLAVYRTLTYRHEGLQDSSVSPEIQ